jgi:hypothetical protein
VSTAYDIAPSGPTPVGPTVTGGDIEDAVLDCLKEWLARYICEVERQHPPMVIGATPAPRGWAITGRDLAKLNPDQLPCVILLAGGVTSAPSKQAGPGVLTAVFGVELGVVFAAAWGRSARRAAQLYARAMHLCLQQRPVVALGQTLIVDWRTEDYDELDFESSRSYSAAICSLNVTCSEVAWANGGPPPEVPPVDDPTLPFEPWVTVTSTDTTVEKYPPSGDLPTAQ